MSLLITLKLLYFANFLQIKSNVPFLCHSNYETLAHFLPNVTSDLRNLREDLSLSGEDSLNWRDFIALMMDKQLVMKEDNLRMVFEHFKKETDRDHLVVSDIVDLVGGSEKQAMDIMQLVDNNSDGRIDFNEFRKMMDDDEIHKLD